MKGSAVKLSGLTLVLILAILLCACHDKGRSSAAVTVTPQVVRQLSDTGTLTYSTPDCRIKGNINMQGEKEYYVPGQHNYGAVKIDPVKGERWFCLEQDAFKNGWRRNRS